MTVDGLTLAEYAAAIGVSERTARRHVDDGHVRVERDGRNVRVPRSELARLYAAREAAEGRAYAAGAAIGLLSYEWRRRFREAVAVIAKVGAALASHLEAAAPDHEADRCQTCADTLDRLVSAEQVARAAAAVAPMADSLYGMVRAAAKAADETRALLRSDQSEEGSPTVDGAPARRSEAEA